VARSLLRTLRRYLPTGLLLWLKVVSALTVAAWAVFVAWGAAWLIGLT
jgi:hypothetical protein